MIGLPGLDVLGGAGSGFGGSSAATATGGNIGSFNFSPGRVSPWLIGAAAVLVLVYLLKR